AVDVDLDRDRGLGRIGGVEIQRAGDRAELRARIRETEMVPGEHGLRMRGIKFVGRGANRRGCEGQRGDEKGTADDGASWNDPNGDLERSGDREDGGTEIASLQRHVAHRKQSDVTTALPANER